MALPSTWMDVDTLDAWLDDTTIRSLQPKLDMIRYEIVRIRKRRIGQYDYWYNPMYTTDIVVKYDNEYYIIFTNVVCHAGVRSKYYRHIQDIHAGYIKITDSTLDIADTLVEYIGTEEDKYNVYDGSKLFKNKSKNRPTCRGDDTFMDYYDDPTPTNMLLSDGSYSGPVTYFTDKYNKWHKIRIDKEQRDSCLEFYYQFDVPEDKFDLLCFALTAYKYTIIYSGK